MKCLPKKDLNKNIQRSSLISFASFSSLPGPIIAYLTLTNVSSFWNMLPWGEGALCQPHSWLYEENGRKQKETKEKRPLNDLLIDRLKLIATMGGCVLKSIFFKNYYCSFSCDANFSCMYEPHPVVTLSLFIRTSKFYLSLLVLNHFSKLSLEWCLTGALLELTVNSSLK